MQFVRPEKKIPFFAVSDRQSWPLGGAGARSKQHSESLEDATVSHARTAISPKTAGNRQHQPTINSSSRTCLITGPMTAVIPPSGNLGRSDESGMILTSVTF